MSLDSARRRELTGLIDRVVENFGWNRLSEGMAVLPGSETVLTRPGSLVFDIDGVLVDTRQSFREVIPMAVHFYLEKILRKDGSEKLLNTDQGDAFKKCGGFNNDWDISEAGLIYALWGLHESGSAPSMESFQQKITSKNGGLDGARGVLTEVAGHRVAMEVLSDVERPLLERIFKELYVGGWRFRELFGEDPLYHFGPGLMEREILLVDEGFIKWAGRCPTGIFTGRIPQETAAVIESLNLTGKNSPDCVVSMDGVFPTKPDPAGLVHIATEITARPLLYFGDNRDDLQTLLGARRQLRQDDLHFVYCLTGAADMESAGWFASSGAGMIVVEVKDIQQVMEL